MCTCPPKYTLNPYTGCSHACIYCYISTYIRKPFVSREKKEILEDVRRDVRKISDFPVSLSNSSDPYPPIEKEKKVTREILKIFRDNGIAYQVLTKSDIVKRDVDIIKDSRASVGFTITTLKKEVYKILEPKAPSPYRRFKALEKISQVKDTFIRLDPIIPFLNDGEIDEIIFEAKERGAKHVITSTFKPRKDSWQRFKVAFPDIAEKIEKEYVDRVCSSYYLRKEIRYRVLVKVKKSAERHGMSFSTCREGIFKNSSETCDATHLIK